jgi:hypothetical protein
MIGSRGSRGAGEQRGRGSRGETILSSKIGRILSSGESFHPKSKILSSGESKIQNRLTGD